MDSGRFSQTGSPRPSGDPAWTSRRRATVLSRWALPHPTLVWAIAAAWAVAVAAQVSGRGQALHHDALAEGGLPPWAALGLFLLAWQLMIAAMMLPSSLPLIRLFGRASANQPRPLPAKAAFLGGYVVVWTSFGAVAFLSDMAIHRAVDRWEWLAARPSLIGGAVLLLAGAFQFSRLKEACLTVCRHPAGYLLQHYRRGTSAAFRLGAGHGVFCVGCCWALMLVAFAAGVASLWWMAALTAVMVFEKTGPAGQRGVRPIGLGLIVLGILMLASPAAHTLAAWRVTDLDAEMADLRTRGATFEEYDLPGLKPVDGVAEWGRLRGAWFKDSEGNVLGVTQLLSDSSRS
jgi:predicted metal-binding membrane protein